jgi:hypothetical protein
MSVIVAGLNPAIWAISVREIGPWSRTMPRTSDWLISRINRRLPERRRRPIDGPVLCAECH